LSTLSNAPIAGTLGRKIVRSRQGPANNWILHSPDRMTVLAVHAGPNRRCRMRSATYPAATGRRPLSRNDNTEIATHVNVIDQSAPLSHRNADMDPCFTGL